MSEEGPEPVECVSPDDWATVVANVPVASVDLVVRTKEGVLLGKRRNRPAKGEWFVPGGRIRKGERLEEAVHRVAHEELGLEVTIVDSLGAYDHLYADSDVPESGGKHYVAHGYLVEPVDGTAVQGDDQHGEVRAFDPPPADLHEYVEAYLRDAGIR